MNIYIPKTGLYLLHQGEPIISNRTKHSKCNNITVKINHGSRYVGFNDVVDALKRVIWEGI